MKLMIALWVALGTGFGIYGVHTFSQTVSRPSSDFLTRALRKQIDQLLKCNYRPIVRYVNILTPLFDELPLPPPWDLPLFLGLHGLLGAPLWIVMAFAFPRAAGMLLPLCMAIALPAPYVWLKQRQRKFHTALLKALPEWLELQALVMEAGLDFNAGVLNYLEKGSPSPLQSLLRETQKEIQMGRSRTEAFSNLSRKTHFQPLREVCRAIRQSLVLGSQMAPQLRAEATALRVKRMQVAEKKAAEAPLKMLFPLFVFIFPTIFIVLLGPMAMMFMQGGF